MSQTQQDPDLPRAGEFSPEFDAPGGKLIAWLLAVPVLVIIGMVMVGIVGELQGSKAPVVASVGDPAPPIRAEGWINGDAPDSSAFEGKVVLVEAWATWCGPCRKQAPHMVEMYKQFKDRDVVFVGLTSEPEQARGDIELFLRKMGITWLNGYGAHETMQALGAEFIPAIYIIGGDGKLAWTSDISGTPEHALNKALKAIGK